MATSSDVILEATKSGDLVLPNMADMQRQIADQIRAFMLNMIPTETAQKLVENAWAHFTKPQVVSTRDAYGHARDEQRPSLLQQMFITEMQSQIAALVRKFGADFQKAAAGDQNVTSAIMDHYENMTRVAAKAYMDTISAQIVGQALAASDGRLPCTSCHQAFVQANQNCPRCGAYCSR